MIQNVFRTEDGEIWDSLEEAKEHQSRVDIWNKLLEEYGSYGELRISYFSDFLDVIKFYEENKQ